MTSESAWQLKKLLHGTCDGVERAIERLGIELDEVEALELLLDANLERCPYCDWWFESYDLVDDEGELVGCSFCRREYG